MLLSHEALDSLCTPPQQPQSLPGLPGLELCPLERFLGCVSLKRYLDKILKEENVVSVIRYKYYHFLT